MALYKLVYYYYYYFLTIGIYNPEGNIIIIITILIALIDVFVQLLHGCLFLYSSDIRVFFQIRFFSCCEYGLKV